MRGTLAKTERRPGRWYDASPFGALRKEMDELFENFFGPVAARPEEEVEVPRLDVTETPEAVQVKTDLPGVKPEEVEIEVRDNRLTIHGEHVEETEKEEDGKRKFHRVERRTGRFTRTVWLPANVREEAVEAELKDGVLTITLPKVEQDQPVKIPVKG